MGRKPVPYTDEEIERYRLLKAEGLNNRQIAVTMPGRSINSVRHLGEKLSNIERRTLLADGKITWTTYNITRLRELYDAGNDALSIAKALQSSYSAISSAISRYCARGPDVAMRKCLPCGQMFPSLTKGNRICNRCRNSEPYRCAA